MTNVSAAALSVIERRHVGGHTSFVVSDVGQGMSVFCLCRQLPSAPPQTVGCSTSSSFFSVFFPPDFFLPLSLLPVISGMTGNYLLTNPLLRTHDTNPYNNLLAETVVCNTPSPPAFHSPGAHPPSTFYSYADLCFCVLGLSSYRGEFDETIYTTHVSCQLAAC